MTRCFTLSPVSSSRRVQGTGAGAAPTRSLSEPTGKWPVSGGDEPATHGQDGALFCSKCSILLYQNKTGELRPARATKPQLASHRRKRLLPIRRGCLTSPFSGGSLLKNPHTNPRFHVASHLSTGQNHRTSSLFRPLVLLSPSEIHSVSPRNGKLSVLSANSVPIKDFWARIFSTRRHGVGRGERAFGGRGRLGALRNAGGMGR